MSDKLFSTVAVTTSFVDGEQPTAAKLSTIAAQLKRTALFLERAVGDLDGESWPYSSSSQTRLSDSHGHDRTTGVALTGTEERSLDIASLGRLIGPASNINPRQADQGDATLSEVIPVGVHEFSTRFPIAGTISGSNPGISDGALTTYVASGELAAAGEYTVTSEGKVFCWSETTGGAVTYNTDPRSYGGGANNPGATFNVIPDPNQLTSGGDGCSLSSEDSFGRRTVTLPLITHQQSNILGDSAVLDLIDPNYNFLPTLPGVLGDLAAEDVIPSGFLYLKNFSTGEVYKDATYYYVDSVSYLIGDVDLDEAVSLGHKFQTVTTGSSITSAIDDLRQKHMHSHDRSFGEPFIDISSISGQYAEAGSKGPYTQSSMPGNPFAQYLHRDGWSSTDDYLNDQNVMRGDLVLGITSVESDPGERYNLDGTTVKLVFGHQNGFRFIKQDVTPDRYLYLKASDNADGESYFIVDPQTQFQEGLQSYGNVGAAPYPDSAVHVIGNTSTTLVAYSTGLLAGDDGVSKWEYASPLDTLLSDFSTDAEWKRPVFQVYHYSDKTVEFAVDTTGGNFYLVTPIELDYVPSDTVLSISVMVKGSPSDSKWNDVFLDSWSSIGSGLAYWDSSDNPGPLSTSEIAGVSINRNNEKIYINIGKNAIFGAWPSPTTTADTWLMDIKIHIVAVRNGSPVLE